MAFRDHLEDVAVLSAPDMSIGELPLLSDEKSNAQLLMDPLQDGIGCSTALNICQPQVIANSMGISSGDLVDLVGWAISNPQNPKIVPQNDATVFENRIDAPDLSMLPIPHYYDVDAGRYLTSAMVFVNHQGISNASFHRMLVLDSQHLTARIVPRHLHRIVEENRSEAKGTDIAIVIGADPVVLLAAAISFDFESEEIGVAAALHERGYGRNLELASTSSGILVPAHAEIILEGTILQEDVEEGPFVDITGTIDDVRKQPKISIEVIHHRDNPVFHALIPAGIEHRTLMGLPRAPTIKQSVEKVVKCLDVQLTDAGSGWLSAVVSIEKSGSGQGIEAIHAAFSGHPSMKKVTIVDGDVNINSPEEVEWAVLTRSQPDKDYVILSGQRGSSLDPSRAEDGTTSKLGIDATIPYGHSKEPFRRFV